MRNNLLYSYFVCLTGYFICLNPASANFDINATDVIDDIKKNEYLYKDVELHASIEYKLVDPVITRADHIQKDRKDLRIVKQHENMFYDKIQRSVKINKDSLDMKELYGYDGEKSRHVQAGIAANLSLQPKEFSEVAHTNPFNVLLSRDFVEMPLSRYLQGGKELREFSYFKDKDVKTTLEGEEIVDGLRCHRLRIVVSFIGRKPIEGWYRLLWIAPERNYLPVKWVEIDETMGPNFPMFTARAEDFREIAPGIWHPFLCTIKCYPVYNFVDLHKYLLANVQIYRFDSVKLDPHYPDSFFRDIKFPDGLPVYVVEHGKIVDSYVQGRPRTSPPARRSWSIALIVAVGVAIGVGVFLVARRKKRKPLRADDAP